MKVFVLTPLREQINAIDLASLKMKADVTVITEVRPLEQITELFEGTEERVLALDPDFCDWNITNDVFDRVPNLKALIIGSTSFSWLDVDYLAKKDVPVINTKGFSSKAVAEWGMMMVQNLARKIPLVIKSGWIENYDTLAGIELEGQTAGIVGLGNIGKEFAKRAKGAGMKVRYWSRSSRDEHYNFVDLDTLFKTSDVVYIALEKNEETMHLITDDMLRSMKRSTIIATAGSGVLNHELLLSLAQEKKIFGYGFEGKPGTFINYEGNVWAGPSLGWCTEESFQRNVEIIIDNVKKAAGGDYSGRVN